MPEDADDEIHDYRPVLSAEERSELVREWTEALAGRGDRGHPPRPIPWPRGVEGSPIASDP